MALSIQRLRYYDGEYLRAADFTDEQNYQVQMRRRLHLALGDWGIVYGLDIASDTEGATTTYAINPGVAIDPAGREIFVFNAYQLDDSVLTQNLITSPGTYQLLLQYQLLPITPPAAGYGQCGGGNQNTRWSEGFQVLIRSKTWQEPTPFPVATDSLSENAATDGFAVPIARIVIAPDASGSLVIGAKPSYENRRYWGTRTQRILPPVSPKASDIDLTAAQTPLNPPTSIEVDGSVYVQDNVIVGKNYDLSLTSGAPTPAASGTVKVAGDIVLQGKIYTKDSSDKWNDLVAAIQSQVVPQIVNSTTPVLIVIPPSNPTDVHNGSFNTSAQAPSGVQPGTYTVSASAWIAGVIYRPKATVDAVFASGADAGVVQYQVTVEATPNSQGAALNFTWNISPVMNSGGVFVSAIDTLVVSYMVVFSPKPA